VSVNHSIREHAGPLNIVAGLVLRVVAEAVWVLAQKCRDAGDSWHHEAHCRTAFAMIDAAREYDATDGDALWWQ
jgi:hypothetical protein